MTQKQIITILAKWFNLSEITSLQDFDGTVANADAQSTQTLNDLVLCTNLVVDELACDYFPLLIVEKVESQQRKIDFSSLAKTILKVFALKDEFGANIPYKTFPTYLLLGKDQKCDLTYSYAPTQPQTITQALDIVSSVLTPRIVAFGVAKEYCLLKSLYDQADYYNARFVNALENVKTKQSSIRLPKRRWI